MDPLIVFQLVKVPPNHLLLTYGKPIAEASSFIEHPWRAGKHHSGAVHDRDALGCGDRGSRFHRCGCVRGGRQPLWFLDQCGGFGRQGPRRRGASGQASGGDDRQTGGVIRFA